MVVVYHAARHLDKAFGMPGLLRSVRFGHAGVDFFFVISGFIILFVHSRDIGAPNRLAHYAGRRFTRVMPTYWVALSLTIAMATAGSRSAPALGDVIRSVLLLPSDTEPLLGVAWTLQYEIVFYALFAVLIAHRSAGRGVMALWLAWIAMGVAGVVFTNIPGSLYGIYNLEFFFGMAAAHLLARHRVPRPRWVLGAGLMLFGACCALESAGPLDGQSGWARLAYGIPAALIILGLVESERQGLLAVPRALKALGSASYSIYLFQFVFIGLTWRAWLAAGLDHRLPHGAAFPVLAGAGVAGGIVMSRLVEYPLMRLIRGASARTNAPPPASGLELIRPTPN